jgi:hypothetical protein
MVKMEDEIKAENEIYDKDSKNGNSNSKNNS